MEVNIKVRQWPHIVSIQSGCPPLPPPAPPSTTESIPVAPVDTNDRRRTGWGDGAASPPAEPHNKSHNVSTYERTNQRVSLCFSRLAAFSSFAASSESRGGGKRFCAARSVSPLPLQGGGQLPVTVKAFFFFFHFGGSAGHQRGGSLKMRLFGRRRTSSFSSSVSTAASCRKLN